MNLSLNDVPLTVTTCFQHVIAAWRMSVGFRLTLKWKTGYTNEEEFGEVARKKLSKMSVD